MPKNKKRSSSSSDSDSGPDDVCFSSSFFFSNIVLREEILNKEINVFSFFLQRNPPPSKKPAPAPAPSKKSTSDEDDGFHLGNNRFVKVREFRGRVMVDIREFYEKDGELKPGKKGKNLFGFYRAKTSLYLILKIDVSQVYRCRRLNGKSSKIW